MGFEPMIFTLRV